MIVVAGLISFVSWSFLGINLIVTKKWKYIRKCQLIIFSDGNKRIQRSIPFIIFTH